MKFILNKDKLEIQNIGEQNSGSINYYIADVEYDSSWNNLTIEAVIIKRDDETGISRAVLNNKIYIDKEYQGQYFIGFKGYTIENNEKTYQISSNLVAIYFDRGAGEIEVQNGELPKPSEWEIYISQATEILNNAQEATESITEALEQVNTAITETNNLNIDVNKENKTATVTLTKKDNTTKTVQISDGISLQFTWDGTKLGIKTEEQESYTFVDLQGIQGPAGPQGEPFKIKKTYSNIAEMNADFGNMQLGDYVMIASSVEIEDNAKLYTRGEQAWIFITDFSGATGIQGPTGLTPNIQIGTVTSGNSPSVTRSGTNENPILNFVLVKGDQGEQGNPGPTGVGISSITKTSTSGLVDTYTITYTNGNTTTFTVTNGEDGEVTQAQLDELATKIAQDRATYKTTPGTGETVTLDKTAEMEFKKPPLPGGNTKQNTTTGKNKLDVLSYKTAGTEETINGVKYKVNSDGSISVNGTASALSSFVIYGSFSTTEIIQQLDNTKTYRVSSKVSVSDINFFLRTYDGSSLATNTSGTSFSGKTGITAVYVQVESGKTINNMTVYPQLEEGTTETTYEKYTGGIASPNPDYPQAINNVTGNVNVSVVNKNLAWNGWAQDFVTRINDSSKASISTVDGRNCLTFAASAGHQEYDTKYLFKTKWKENTQYTFSFDMNSTVSNGNIKLLYTDGSEQIITTLILNTWNNVVLTSHANKTIKYLHTFWSSGSSKIDLNTFMVEEGTSASAYIANQTQTKALPLGSVELCKIGDYQDYVFKNVIGSEHYNSQLTPNKWYLHKEIGKVTLDGSETWATFNTTYKRNYISYTNLGKTFMNNSNGFSNYFVKSSNTQSVNGFVFTSSYLYLRISDDITTGAQFTSWLNNHNTDIYGVLAEPTDTEITDPSLINALDEVEAMLSYEGQTNIYSTNELSPIFDVEAYQSIKLLLS